MLARFAYWNETIAPGFASDGDSASRGIEWIGGGVGEDSAAVEWRKMGECWSAGIWIERLGLRVCLYSR